MRRRTVRLLILPAAAALALTACSDGGDDAADEQVSAAPSDAASAPSDLGAAGSELPDPNDDVEDGVYRGAGVVLPVPEGWTLSAAARQQGIVAAQADTQDQQMSAQAVDRAEAEAAGQALTLDSLLEALRSQAPGEPAVDEEVELAGADRAHRLTFLDIPGAQEGQPASSATIIVAQSEERIGEFVVTGTAEAYDESLVDLLLEQAGFDPGSQPPSIPTPAPGPTTQDVPAPTEDAASPDDTASTDDAASPDDAATAEDTAGSEVPSEDG